LNFGTEKGLTKKTFTHGEQRVTKENDWQISFYRLLRI